VSSTNKGAAPQVPVQEDSCISTASGYGYYLFSRQKDHVHYFFGCQILPSSGIVRAGGRYRRRDAVYVVRRCSLAYSSRL